jgi:DNA-binding Lrp family transcriptional regulator
MSDLDLRLLNDFQRDFPLVAEPFAALARQLGTGEDRVLAALSRLQGAGAVSRVGAVFRPHQVGASTLAALSTAAARLEEVARLVSGYPEVNHNYEREHHYNLWFVVTAPDEARVRQVLAEIEAGSGSPVLYLPMLEDYHIDLGFDLTGHAGHSREMVRSAQEYRPQPGDWQLIAAIQSGLPLISRPYAEIGRRAGMSEEQVIRRLAEMQEGGAIKRLGIIVRHHELGFRANAMAVWDVPDDAVARMGRCVGAYDFVTLCYRRSRQLPAWRYNFYCMIHGRDRDTVQQRLATLQRECGLDAFPHELLFSRRRFKQCGARYAEASQAEKAA